MWYLTTEGFYSVVRWHDGRMCVRSRRRVDLTRLRKIVPALSEVEITPGRDYRYRAFCTVDEWADGAAALARTITYGNFKSAVAKKRGYKDPYEGKLHAIWSILSRLQPGGAYGTSTRAGYPAIPKGERGIKPARRRYEFPPLRPPIDGQTSLDNGWPLKVICDDCGAPLSFKDAIEVDGEFVHRDVFMCSNA